VFLLRIEKEHLEQALFLSSLRQFEDIPPEDEIDHSFSEHFENWIQRISHKSEKVVWRCWRSPIKRIAIIAVIIALLLGMIACTPAIRNALVDFFMKDTGESYEITFDPEVAATAPHSIEQYRVPSYEPEGYMLVYRNGSSASVDLLWINEMGGTLGYSQSFIPEDTTNGSWIGIDSTGMERSTEVICGYRVELLYNEMQYVAVWTDNQYIYTIDFVNYNIDPKEMVASMIASIIEVSTVEPMG
jgi:hypothetical protein